MCKRYNYTTDIFEHTKKNLLCNEGKKVVLANVIELHNKKHLSLK